MKAERSPHEALSLARLLRPLKALVQEDIPSDEIDGQEPNSLHELWGVDNEVRAALSFLRAGTSFPVPEQTWQRGKMHTPHNPRDDKVAGLDKGCCDERKGSSGQPNKDEANARCLQ